MPSLGRLRARVPTALALLALSALTACGATTPRPSTQPPTPSPSAASSVDTSVDIATARARGLPNAVEWQPYAPATFARAKAEGKLLLVDGAAEWCHWCHVMDETTYRDPEVGKLIAARFIAVRVDIDARPDLADRWSDWGWPATIVMAPDGRELGKFRGYLRPERLREVLGSIDGNALDGGAEVERSFDRGAPVAALGWVGARALLDLDGFWDEAQGGWGSQQKAPIGANIEVELGRASAGDRKAGKRAAFILSQQRAIIDPVFGGIYQYSAGHDWSAPHFEKLMSFQAPQIEAYARGYAVLGDRAWLATADALGGYVASFLRAPDGTFYVNQDADLGAHDHGGRFVDGHTYYALDDAHRRALGTPWVDTHVYARENGLAIAAFATLFEVGKDRRNLALATTSAAAIKKSHVGADGSVVHDAASREGPRYLADAAALARGYAVLARASGDGAWLTQAESIATNIVASFADPSTGLLFDATVDPAAGGVFARREPSFPHAVVAARAFCAIGAQTKKAEWTTAGQRTLAAIASPKRIDAQGRFLGELLLALDECGVRPW
jgi:uncharacterized protein YyaL (SSP411 family)